MKISWFELLLIVLGGVVLLFIAAPLAGMFLHTHFSGIIEAAGDRDVQSSIWLTIWTAITATVLFSVLAIPFSYLLARKNFPLKRLICGIIELPVVIPHSAAGIAILGLFSKNTVIGKFSQKIGINYVDNPAGIIIAMAFVSLPFLISSAKSGFEDVPLALEKAAFSLGASSGRVFLTISLPLAWRSILSGMIMMWARGLSEFGAVIVIAYHPAIVPVLIYERFTSFGLKYAQPVAALFVLICLVSFIVFRLLLGKGRDVSRYN